jgi:iron complex transport system substrate-binding protein
MIIRFCFSLLLLGIAVSCTRDSNIAPPPSPSKKVSLVYAEGFQITKDSVLTWIEVKQPYQGATQAFHYILVPKTSTVPNVDPKYKIIRTPLSSIVCTSTTHIPLLDYLQQSDKLVGFPTTDYISSSVMRKRVDAGNVVDVGVDKGMNIEKIVALRPDIVMGYSMTSEYGQFKKIEDLGIPVVINAEYLEQHPLGRAEWIKFMGALFHREKEADSVFQMIEKEYIETSRLVKDMKEKPTVLSGILYGDAWFLPGGKNYASTILSDAGMDYVWKNDSSHGYLELSFESVYEKANNADYWVGVGSFQDVAEMAAADHRYKRFKPFRDKNIFSYDARKGAKGGNEYLELGTLRPDLILKDLVKIGHPEILPDHTLFFHRRLD